MDRARAQVTQRVRHGERLEPAVECLALRKGTRASFGLPDVAEAWTRPTITGVYPAGLPRILEDSHRMVTDGTFRSKRNAVRIRKASGGKTQGLDGTLITQAFQCGTPCL